MDGSSDANVKKQDAGIDKVRLHMIGGLLHHSHQRPHYLRPGDPLTSREMRNCSRGMGTNPSISIPCASKAGSACVGTS